MAAPTARKFVLSSVSFDATIRSPLAIHPKPEDLIREIHVPVLPVIASRAHQRCNHPGPARRTRLD